MKLTLLAVLSGSALGLAAVSATQVAISHTRSDSEEIVDRPMWSDRFPDVLLQTHDGRTVRFYEDLIKGKVVAINFMYVGCTRF